MSVSKRLFRESALERLSSPEQLDQLLQVMSPRGWISLIAVWALLAAIIAWSILASVPSTVEGRGIIVAGGGLMVVVSPGNGRLTEILPSVGDRTTEGQIVATIDQRGLEDELVETESQLKELQAQHDLLLELDRREEEVQKNLAETEIQRLEQTAEFARQRIGRLSERRVIIDRLVDQGAMTPIDLHKVDEDIEDTKLQERQARLQIQQLAAKNREASFRRERRRMERKLTLDELAGKVSMLQRRLERESKVRSHFAGMVVEVRAAVQTTVGVGDQILVIQPEASASERLQAILYVSAATGGRIELGDVVHISPSTVKREEHGSMVGTVSFVDSKPTSKQAMLALLRDQDQVDQFTSDIGLALELHVSLNRDASTLSGYEWTSVSGPPTEISARTLCEGSVTVDTQRPIELVIPMARKKLGGD